MGNISESLQRKIGPFPVWIWAVVGGLLLYVIRNRMSGGGGGGTNQVAATTAEAQLVQAEAAARASTMQSPQVVSAGEQVYDPNTSFLSQPVNTDLQQSLVGLIGTLIQPTAPPASPVPAQSSKPSTTSKAPQKPRPKPKPKPKAHKPKTTKPKKKKVTHHK